MKQPARLITPRGKTIELPADIYKQVQQLLSERKRRSSRAHIENVIRSTYGKYAGDKSLTQALLKEHAAERAREDSKFKRRNA